MLLASAVWLLCSVEFLDVAWHKVVDLRTAGQYVSPLRYGQVGFWVLMIGIWIAIGWKSFKRYRVIER